MIDSNILVNATIFNSPIAYACSFNTELVEKMAGAIAQEALALGVNQLFAPLGDLARELRFGRVEETFGEDSHLSGEMAYSFVTGLQNGHVSSTVKHFAAYGSVEQGINTAPVRGGERELRTTYLPSYKRAIIDAGAWAIMAAYSAYDGVGMVVNHHVLSDILRDEWGYDYWVMSDASGTDTICLQYNMCQADPIDSEAITLLVSSYTCPFAVISLLTISKALNAGTDIEMGGGHYNFRTIPSLVESGKLNISVVDTAVSRVLRMKFTMGLFENPYLGVSANETSRLIHTNATLALARELDGESIVLLENKRETLPLSKSAHIAVIGPMAHGYMNVSVSSTYVYGMFSQLLVWRLRRRRISMARSHPS